MKLADRAAIVGWIPIFHGLRKKDLLTLARSARMIHYEAFSKIIEEGDPGDAAYVMVEGEAEVRRNGRKVAVLSAGAVFGEMALIDGGERSASVTLTTRGDVLKVPRAAFEELLASAPSVARSVMEQMAARVRQLDQALYG